MFGYIIKRPRKEQYELNVGGLLAMYYNGMCDSPDEYKPMTLDEVIDYVNSQVYTFIDDGCGGTYYGGDCEKLAQSLKFIPKKDKLEIIERIAREEGILKED